MSAERLFTPETCESVRCAASIGEDVEWYRWMFSVCDCTVCDPDRRMFPPYEVSR